MHAPRNLPRPRLRDALLEADCRLRLLWAQAGSGKSTLLDECMEQCPADTRLVRLDLRGQPLAADTLLARLGRALCLPGDDPQRVRDLLIDQAQALWLVLDDYPRTPDEALDQLLNELVQESSTSVRWWIASRRRPHLQLTRMLLSGDLFELDGRELAFTPDEVCELVSLAGHAWQRQELLELHRWSEGWCAGVRLRLLGLKPGQPLPAECNHELMLDYLRREVLDELPGDWQLALFSLAHFPQFDAPLCEQLLGVGEGAALLKHLRECALFVEPVDQDEQALRIQPAIAALLAEQLPASMTKALFRKACQHYLGLEHVRPALEYALRAGQPEVAASLMERYTEDRLLQGRGIALLLEWQHELPQEMLVSTLRLTLLNGWATVLSGRLDEAQHYIHALERCLPQPSARRQQELVAQIKALAGKLAFHRGDIARGVTLLAEAVEELPERAWSQRLVCRLMLVEQALIEGQFERAQELNREAIKQAREHGSLAFESLLTLEHAKLLEMRGELLRAESLLRRLHAELTQAWGAEPSPMRGRTQLLWASLLLQRGHYEEAETTFVAGMQECRACADPAVVWGCLGLVELDALHGDYASAFARIADAERELQYQHIDAQHYRGVLLAAKARLWLAQGQHGQVEKSLLSAHEAGRHLAPFGVPDMNLRLNLLLNLTRLQGDGRPDALATLEQMHAEALAAGRRPLACEIGFSLAEGLHGEGRYAQAKQAFLDALALARQMGLVSVEQALAQRNPTMMRWAVESTGTVNPQLALLSKRELDVLKLIARGLSNQQIAEELFISLHTVKTHAQRINFKLGVERRTQAVARAKELGLTA
nr:LuxR C-terminal-related transcriptional regulator [Pseudomonas sp. BMS12]